MDTDQRIPVSPATAGAAQTERETALVLGPGEAMPAEVPPGAAVERLALRQQVRHEAGCVCCAPRAALAEALHRLFLRRARGEVPFFRRVVVSLPAGEIGAALADPLIASRFRADGVTSGTGFRCD
ncbi:MAG: hypothetical protein MUC89_09460 [Acetobacteraceae bacterium]|jgi:hypothetical protein|nr:hypothetical protein [Acetobacteraceae bacterium]